METLDFTGVAVFLASFEAIKSMESQFFETLKKPESWILNETKNNPA